MKLHSLAWILVGIMLISGCAVKEPSVGDSTLAEKENNICAIDSDCEYIWYTGGCNTPEYANKIMEKCQAGSGPCPSEAQPRENVTCSCENKACATYG